MISQKLPIGRHKRRRRRLRRPQIRADVGRVRIEMGARNRLQVVLVLVAAAAVVFVNAAPVEEVKEAGLRGRILHPSG